jgi:hypothetical protein
MGCRGNIVFAVQFASSRNCAAIDDFAKHTERLKVDATSEAWCSVPAAIRERRRAEWSRWRSCPPKCHVGKARMSAMIEKWVLVAVSTAVSASRARKHGLV